MLLMVMMVTSSMLLQANKKNDINLHAAAS